MLPWLLPLGLGLWACSSDSAGGGPAGGNVMFHADVSAVPGFNYDTGLQPSGSPVQLQLKVSASGNGAIDASAAASGSASAPVLTALPGSGNVSIEGSFGLEGRLVVDVTGLPKYDGPVPGLDNVKIEFHGLQSFDPYLLSSTATAKAEIPPTDLPSIPLPGGLPGSLIIKVAQGSTVNLEFQGVCAAIGGDQAQYTGTVTRAGSLILQPRVEIDVPMLGTKSFDIPQVTAPISSPAQAVDLGTQTVSFGSAPATGTETAKVGSCSGDGGVGGSGQGGSGQGGSGQGGTGQGGTGQGGSGQGGGGGTGTGGSGGDAGDACQLCGQGACATQETLCKNDAECSKLWDCDNACTGTPQEIAGCKQGCLLSHPSAQDAYFRMQGCFYAKCHDSCGLPACLFGVGDATCDNCLQTTCSAECAVASDSQDCMTYMICVSDCSGISCTANCNNYPTAGCSAVDTCLANKCTTECGYPPPDASP